MFVIAGPAGSGKSTVFPLEVFGVARFSVDDRCAQLNEGSYAAISAALRARVGAECRDFIERHIEARTSLAVETTLRTNTALEQARAARAAGFFTVMLFVGTSDVRVNVERITARGRMGGHSSPAADIEAIYAAAMANLPRAIEAFDRVDCFDNTPRGAPPRRVLAFERQRVVQRDPPLPAWAQAIEPAR